MMGLYGLMGIGTVFNNVALNMTKTLGNSSQLTLQQQRHDATEASWLFLLILIDTYWQFMTVK